MSSPQMPGPEKIELPHGLVFTNRIIWSALLVGELVMAIALGKMTAQAQTPHDSRIDVPLLALIAFCLLGFAIAVRLVVPRVLRFGDLTDEAAVRQRYATRMIIPMAALEGAALAGMVFVFLTGKWMPIGIVPVTAIALQLTVFPRGRLPV